MYTLNMAIDFSLKTIINYCICLIKQLLFKKDMLLLGTKLMEKIADLRIR